MAERRYLKTSAQPNIHEPFAFNRNREKVGGQGGAPRVAALADTLPSEPESGPPLRPMAGAFGKEDIGGGGAPGARELTRILFLSH